MGFELLRCASQCLSFSCFSYHYTPIEFNLRQGAYMLDKQAQSIYLALHIGAKYSHWFVSISNLST